MASSPDRLTTASRLVGPRYAPGLDGEGARRFPGRWNSAGNPMTYRAANVSLAVLETFVHLPAQMRTARELPGLVLVTLPVLGDAVAALDVSAQDTAALRSRRRIGDEWMASGRSVGSAVASHVVPHDRNVLPNPRHPDFAAADVVVVAQEPFRYDPRMGR